MPHRRVALALALTLCAAPLAAAPPDDRGEEGIVGGTPTTGFPAVVALLDGAGELFCTAFLIRPGCLVTAAHCVDTGLPLDSTAFFGSVVGEPGGVSVVLTDALVHPQWGQQPPEFDLAVVSLETAVAVPVVAFGAPGPDGTQITLVGFGEDELGDSGVKRTATTQLLDSTSTQLLLDGTTSNVCFGDSGGPVLRDVSGELRAVGVASVTGDDCLNFGVAARIDNQVASFIDPAADEICTAILDPTLFVDGFETGDTSRWSATVPRPEKR